ncbi:26S proteasome non-ATPase regulatory subunit 9 [Sparganum proliferum]
MNTASLSARFQELDLERKRIESEVAEFAEVLKSNQNVGMHGPLIDADGFPRSDIDIVAVRTARNRIICLNTDHAAVMRELESVSSRLLDAKQPGQSVPIPMDTSDGSQLTAKPLRATLSSEPSSYSTPFLLVDQVTPGSAAELAGIQVNDQLTRFGSVSSANFVNLSSIASVVKLTAAKSAIPITVLRLSEGQQNFHNLSLFKPLDAGGLGLHVVPLRK